MKNKKKYMFFRADGTHNLFDVCGINNENFEKVNKALNKQDDKNFEFMMQIDSLQEQIEFMNIKTTFKFNIRHIADISKKLAEIAVFPALLSIIYYCFK